MLNYRGDSRRTQRPEFLSRKQQYSLLLLVFALLTVLFLMVEAGKPANWDWFFRLQDSSKANHAGAEYIPTAANRTGNFAADAPQRDTSWHGSAERDAALPAGVFRSLGSENDELGNGNDPLWQNIPWSTVKDDTVFRSEESTAWYQTLAAVSKADLSWLKQNAVGEVHFNQLFDATPAYRGHIVNVSGIVRRAHRMPAPPNEFNVDEYWQCWLFPDHSVNPIVIYAVQMPNEFPEGMQIVERARFVGIPFKRWTYAAASGVRRAPLVIARITDWQPETRASTARIPSGRTVAIAIALCILTVYFMFRMACSTAFGTSSAALKTLAKESVPWNHGELQDADLAASAGDYLQQLQVDDERDTA